MDKIERELILIQRRNHAPEDHGSHGIWKIAYADFMTALMAFFLIMWLLNITDQEQRTAVANYFNPVKLTDMTVSRKGVDDPQEIPPENGPKGDKAHNQEQQNIYSSGDSTRPSGDSGHISKPRYQESALFQDPYAILAKLADDKTPPERQTAQTAAQAAMQARSQDEAAASNDVRDPFDPAYWRMAPEGTPDMPLEAGQQQAGTQNDNTPPADKTIMEATRPSDPQKAIAPDAAADAEAQKQANEVAELKHDVDEALKQETLPSAAPGIAVERTSEGILIRLSDAEAYSMFASGSAEPKPEVVRALARIGKMLEEHPGTVVIRGHTDAVPFRSANYDNWRLSSARAHMASYMLIRGGLDENRIEHIEGYAARLPQNTNDPRAAENRRIEILLREQSR
ncbi:flagellar motor protein MotB [Pseudochelatococcus contaminans]|uniref:Chemotaxis protein MotB n=1 Tax=Pseudochelatococcus contaminans TaxID=1538103 RepID=A0A7W5Z1H7_9HYPH|nr:flagellar motor protein MotB [Pseudochelatococcus contaminans]MBB3808360.1 chemotaxis protein MotB [Pseudochelatococcus contaminans]